VVERGIFAAGNNGFLNVKNPSLTLRLTGINGGNNGRNRGDTGILMILCFDL
jgi:hypothetical protein